MIKRRVLLTFISCILMSSAVYAGDIRKIKGEATYLSPRTETPEQALKNAIREAQIDALRKEFGETVSERTLSISETAEGHTENKAHSIGESLLNGEWLRDLKTPKPRIEQTEHGTIYYVSVYGEARERKFNPIDVDCRILCNGTDPDRNRLRGDMFYEGDEMYVYFNSPVDGWLAMYLVDDDERQTTQCLVPYDGQRMAAYPIKANKEYVFFSKSTAEPEYAEFATRMIVESRKKTDFNILYVIFSPKEFNQVPSTVYKASKHSEDTKIIPEELMPRETTHLRFDKWLHNVRRSDENLQPLQFTFSINKK